MNATSYPGHPTAVGRYELLLPIASGGMGTVYLARAKGVGGFEKEFAVKLMHAHLRENRDFATDLIEEAKLAVRIRHRNVVSVFDVGEEERGVYLVMEYVEGDTLASLLAESTRRKRPLSWRVGLRIVLDMLAGLQAAHELCDRDGNPVGLVHRDVSPQNILVGLDGIGRLTDFGIAKASSRLSNTTSGVVKGKVGYMSPEQVRGRPLDRRSDVWAAGVVAWEVMTGKRLFVGEEASVVLRIATEVPPPVDQVVQSVPKELSEAIATALVSDVHRRCPTAAVLARALATAAHEHDLIADPGEVAETVRDLALERVQTRRDQARTRSVVALPRSLEPPSEAATSGDLLPATQEQAGSLPGAATSPRRWRSSHIATVVSAVCVLAAVAVWGSASRSPASPPAPAPAASNTQPLPVALSSGATVSPAPPRKLTITVRSDQPLRELTVEGEPVAMPKPATEVDVEVTDEQFARGVLAEGVGMDGRSLRVVGDEGRGTVSLRFGAPPRSPDTAGKGHPPFAPNPYSNKGP